LPYNDVLHLVSNWNSLFDLFLIDNFGVVKTIKSFFATHNDHTHLKIVFSVNTPIVNVPSYLLDLLRVVHENEKEEKS